MTILQLAVILPPPGEEIFDRRICPLEKLVEPGLVITKRIQDRHLVVTRRVLRPPPSQASGQRTQHRGRPSAQRVPIGPTGSTRPCQDWRQPPYPSSRRFGTCQQHFWLSGSLKKDGRRPLQDVPWRAINWKP